MSQARELGTPLVALGQEQEIQLGDVEAGSTGPVANTFSGPEPFRGSFLQRAFITWVFPLLQRSAETDRLQSSDLFPIQESAQPPSLIHTFMGAWQDEVRRRSARQRPPREGVSLLKTMYRLYIPDMWILWVGRLAEVVLEFGWPFFLNGLLRFAADEETSRLLGFLYALGVFVSQGLLVLIENNVNIGMQSLGLRIRCCLITAIFRKVLLLRQDSLQSFSSGTLNNMITTDADKVRRSLRYLHLLLIVAPIKLTVSLVALHHMVGVAIWISLSWMAFVILLNPGLMMLMGKLQDKLQSSTDERVRRVTEVISAIQVIKCHAWEGPATDKVEDGRRLELKAMWRLYCLYTCLEGLWQSCVPVTTAIMFATYSVFNPDNPLTAAKAFTAMELLDMLQEPLFTIPWVLNNIIEALVSSKRLEKLFLLPEATLPSIAALASFCPETSDAGRPDLTGAEPPDELDGTAVAVGFEKASFAWPATQQREAEDDQEESSETAASPAGEQSADGSSSAAAEFRLSDLNLNLQKGALVAVVGATASGKTSLLHAVLGEMPVAAGVEEGKSLVKRQRPMAFAPQQPWIFNGTVRQNILFGEAFHEQRYTECLRCCDLEKDLELLKDGDRTKVGEKGIALSGGQKARVCLARAAYRQHVSSLFLLDDPYSALDAHVARRVHDEAIQGLLAKKTRLLATNRLEFVSSCDTVIVLEGGKVEAIGKYEQVQKHSQELRKLLAAQGLKVDDETPAPPPPEDLQRQFSRALSYKSANSDDDSRRPEVNGVAGEGVGDEGGEGAEGADEEERATGQLKKEVVFYYLRSMGGFLHVSGLASMYILAEAVQLAIPIWLAHWTTASRTHAELGAFLTPYVVLSLATVIMMIVRDLMGNIYGFCAARRLHRNMLTAVLRAPMSFFQDTPQGRVINRFSKDMHEIDQEIVWNCIYTLVPLVNIVGNFGMVGLTSIFSVIVWGPILYAYYKLWKAYNKAALDMKRLSKVLSSPVYDHFNNLCRENAISVVRALHQVERQCTVNEGFLSDQQRTEYAQIYTENWFSMRMDHLGCILVFSVALCVVLGRGVFLSASSAALALKFSNDCSSSIQSMIGMLAEFGMAFNCVERVMEYCTTLPAEAALELEPRPPVSWPSEGRLEVRNLRLRYRPGLPLVLKGLSFVIEPGERLGVCGRTGAGKSSLLLALLRIVEPETGSMIKLDGQDLATLGLHDVRSNIAMIPQEPVLFQATLRYNCDPFGSYSTERVWEAIEEAQLAPWARRRAEAAASSSSSSSVAGESNSSSMVSTETVSQESILNMEIKEGGQNLSAGQRQMVAIARAVLRRARLVVLDEATAAVDAATDAAIQRAVLRCFHGSTTLTIAHRLKTIADSNRILVLDNGSVAELGTPAELREIQGGIYRGMAEEAE